ncbi:hypothetical protein ACUXP2_000817 [Staphylococcus haemolyticus]|uniref:hypothetical protein n=1 Tax=Staphylococcus TaxID=1279 RepID=UPI0008A843E6|nr:hypothetical protein [Staphylococcus sp. HMSC057G10]OHO94717.1 hypothetical protein HMPREF2563_05965 [Staphylococcus sp. HMSC057G10]
MDKEKVFNKLDAAKESELEIWIGYLLPSSTTIDIENKFQIKYDYEYQYGSLVVSEISKNTRELIDFSTILDFEENKDSLLVIIREEKA